MGDRFDKRRASFGERLMVRRGKPPPSLLAWGLEGPARLGHNNGPPLDDDAPGYLWRRYRWTKAHAAAWKPPSFGIAKFRMARAAAAGIDHRTYVSTLLDTGHYAQAGDTDPRRAAARAQVRAAWSEVMVRCAPAASRVDRGIWLSLLIGTYEGADRHYHDLVHIADVLRGLEAHRAAVVDRDALLLAILYHDLVYDPHRSDNEAESAARAAIALAALGLAAVRIDRVVALIQATAHLATPVALDADKALLLDLDLAILGADADTYRAYAAAIRREYAHVPEATWRLRRASVLDHFLARPHLYRTASIAAALEVRARQNLALERGQLTAQ